MDINEAMALVRSESARKRRIIKPVALPPLKGEALREVVRQVIAEHLDVLRALKDR